MNVFTHFTRACGPLVARSAPGMYRHLSNTLPVNDFFRHFMEHFIYPMRHIALLPLLNLALLACSKPSHKVRHMSAAVPAAAVHLVTNVPLTCDGIWSPDSGEAALRRHFGDSLVRTAQIPLGEGETATGTVVYPNARDRRIEILWKDTIHHRRYDQVIVRDSSTHTVYSGVHTGMTLQALERINGRPFQLAGFNWDYSGTVMSWSGGLLDSAPHARCGLLVRLDPPGTPATAADEMQMSGDAIFESSNPAMQRLNPTIYEIMLVYKSS